MKHPLILVGIVGILFLTQVSASAQSDLRLDLRPELEKAFDAYVSALEARNTEQLKRSLPAFRYMRMRNEAISQGKEFPESVFEGTSWYSDLRNDRKNLRHIKTVLRGNVAYMMFLGTRRFERKQLPFLTSVLFVKEGGQWKFCETELVNLDPKDLRVAHAKLAEQAPLEFDAADVLLAGNLPSVPREYPTPDYLATIAINAHNCLVTVKYNNETRSLNLARFPEATSLGLGGPVIGGLKRGQNAISINVEAWSAEMAKARKSTQPPHAKVEIVVWAGPNRQPVTVFRFETNTLGEVKKEFEVTDEIIAKAKQ